VRVVYSAAYEFDIGSHVWPTSKYRLIYDRLISSGLLRPSDFVAPHGPISWDDLALVHDVEYLTRMREHQLSSAELARLEIPWSEPVSVGFRTMTAGTVLAAHLAVQNAIGFHLGGGFHHAFPNHGEGFCPFNDIAVAIRVLQKEGAIERAAVVDCDVHQGNGTAAVFGGDPSVFTFSIHQEHNYPAWKPPGDLDIGLRDRAGDDEYLARVATALNRVVETLPQVIVYVAGADPYVDDQLGGLGLSKDGLRRRDRLVFSAARARGIPVVVVLAGGYAHRVEDTVDIHAGTVAEAINASEK
jgi:acetoin utilization deacetylase AcuC-like enzyme